MPAGWLLLLAGALLLLGGCRSTASPSGPAPADGASAVGLAIVVAADGVQDAPSRARLQALLEQAFEAEVRDGERAEPVPAAMVAVALGQARFEEIGDRLARGELLSPPVRRELLAMPIPVRRALVVRLERNEVEQLRPRREPLLDTDGDELVDREAIILSTRRLVRIGASLIDLPSGKSLWQRAWQAEPVVAMRYVNYTGSSLAASVATTLTNTVLGGLEGPRSPDAVDAEEAIAALFLTLADELSER